MKEVDPSLPQRTGTPLANPAFGPYQTARLAMWRRRSGSRGFATGRAGSRYSYGTVVLLVAGAILLFLYLTGRLNL
jgi:hypothetical protein